MTRTDIESALVTYCLLFVVRPIVSGTPRRAAAKKSWDLLRTSPFMVRHGVVLPLHETDEVHSVACVASICAALLNIEALTIEASARAGGMLPPKMTVPDGAPADALVAADLIRRLMLGEQAGAALRNATDSAFGRPARHRAPLSDTDVLAFTDGLIAKLGPALHAAGAL